MSIELLHNLVRTHNYLAEQGTPHPKVRYHAKVKMHGSNCAVQIHEHGIHCQSRTGMLDPLADYKGFAKWAHAYADQFRGLPSGFTVFGEWCGPGVEAGMAVSALPGKLFAVFAIQVGVGDAAVLITNPVEIESYLRPLKIAGMYVLPWVAGVDFWLDFADAASLQSAADLLNQVVASVEQEDPFIKDTFGVSGLGEGVVLYPVSEKKSSPEALANLMFKAKGEKHRTAGTKEAVQISAEVVSSVAEFVALMVTEARLEQGLSVVCGGVKDAKMTGKFLAWVSADVEKESVAELEAAGLNWTQVQKAVQTKAREWFLAR